MNASMMIVFLLVGWLGGILTVILGDWLYKRHKMKVDYGGVPDGTAVQVKLPSGPPPVTVRSVAPEQRDD